MQEWLYNYLNGQNQRLFKINFFTPPQPACRLQREKTEKLHLIFFLHSSPAEKNGATPIDFFSFEANSAPSIDSTFCQILEHCEKLQAHHHFLSLMLDWILLESGLKNNCIRFIFFFLKCLLDDASMNNFFLNRLYTY